MSNLAAVLWPLRKAADAMRALARLSGWHVSSTTSPPPPPHELTGQSPEGTPGSLSDFMDAVAKHYGLEADPVLLQLAELDAQLRQAPPALLLVRVPKEGILVVLRGRGERLQILSPDGAQTWIPIALIVDALTQPSFAPLLPEIEALLAETGIGEGDAIDQYNDVTTEVVHGVRKTDNSSWVRASSDGMWGGWFGADPAT